MPRARKRPASPEEASIEGHNLDDVMENPENALKFDEALTWRAGRPIAVVDLLRRLRALYEELQATDQGDAHRETLVPKAQELANVQLLAHKDKGVKAWTLLCIVEMFRLLAPDAPYKGGQLKQIFELFVSTVVPALASPSDPYNQQYLLILTSLTTVKSIILLTDIPSSDGLILNLFTNCFDVMSGNAKGSHGEQLGKNVEFHMTNMLGTLVDECQELPTGVVDIILAQFLRADPHTLSMGSKKVVPQPASFMLREVSPAYNMARSVCNTAADKMSRVIGHYFSSVLIDASETFATAKPKPRGKKRTHDESEDESDDGLLTPPAEEDWREVEKAHRLLRELWRSSPDVISNIIPQMEAEVAAENAQLRIMAVQTVGDMVAGIGAAGPPPPAVMDPATYPSQSLETSSRPVQYDNVLLAPAAPHAFSSVYPAAYRGFVDRHRDKNVQVRSAWAVAAGLIVETAGGGKGLDADQETQLLRYLADLLADTDERVRLAAVQAVARFDFNTVVHKLGNNGGVETSGSVLSTLCDRIKDRKHSVRIAAMELLGRIWGVAAGSIAGGSERMRTILGPIPTKILDAMYVNDREISALVYQVLFDSLLPISYPPIKSKQAVNGDAQRVADSQHEGNDPDPHAIRAERILVLVRDLGEKAKKVFFAMQQQQSGKARYMEQYLKASDMLYGVATEDEDTDEKTSKKELETMIAAFSRMMPDTVLATEHLKKFAKFHDRRSFQLIRFCYSPDSDYRKVVKATKELTKRMEEASSGMLPVLDTLLPIVRSLSVLVNNRSHVPAIMAISQTDDKGLGTAAHEVLKEISSNAPEVFRVHMHELCGNLREQAPTATAPNQPNAVIDLKTVAGFATRFPKDVAQDREFYKAMTAFAKYGTPPAAAKHAVTIIVATADKREMYVKDILSYALKDFESGAECFLSRLAAISQLRLVSNKETEEYSDEIMNVAVGKILGQTKTLDDDTEPLWKEEIDDDLCAKLWALKILVNGLRGLKTSTDPQEAAQEISAVAGNVYKLLNTLIYKNGELSRDPNALTAKHHHARLRLAAANQLLKLSCNKSINAQFRPGDFNSLAAIAQDPVPEVRSGFVKTLKEYLGQGRLPIRFYGIVFLYAFEPHPPMLISTTTWLKARAALSAKAGDTAMENVFSRFLSLLAHHQDFRPAAEDLKDFFEYIMFYLKTVATEANLPLIYHIAQRLKSVQDGIDPEKSDNLYVVSDLAEAVIRAFQDLHGWSLQLHSGAKVRLPVGIFAPLPGHAVAQEIAGRNYLPKELAEDLEEMVRGSLRPSRKRKSDGMGKQGGKRVKGEVQARGGAAVEGKKKRKLDVRKTVGKSAKAVKTPRKKSAEDAQESSVMRKSSRQSGARNYAEQDDSEDDEEMEEWDRDSEDGDGEKVDSSTPPTSDPTPAPMPVEEKPAKEVEAEDEEVDVEEEEEVVEVEEKKAAKKTSGKGKTKTVGKGKAKATARKAPKRSTRATKSKKEKDVLDFPSDSEDLSDVPDGVED
ncbi:Sister chromatid cohesion protein pds5 [Friedmanniomyces endolithicus]|nr:Sister chromatid cohesion protein pds5 [Friedmanniomyces endolithicus]